MRYRIRQVERDMWLKYEKDLKKYGVVRSKEDALKAFKGYEDTDCYYLPIYVASKGRPVGFLIVGTGSSAHPECDYCICEAFVDEDHRSNGVGGSVVKNMLMNHPGRYCLDVFKENSGGRRFWEKVFKEAGYDEIALKYVPHGIDRDKADTLYFEPKKE